MLVYHDVVSTDIFVHVAIIKTPSRSCHTFLIAFCHSSDQFEAPHTVICTNTLYNPLCSPLRPSQPDLSLPLSLRSCFRKIGSRSLSLNAETLEKETFLQHGQNRFDLRKHFTVGQSRNPQHYQQK